MDLITMYLEKQNERGEENVKVTKLGELQQKDGPIIWEWRRSLWITQRQMAAELGISVNRLRAFERGDRVERMKELKKACEWYLNFRHHNGGRERFTTEQWHESHQAQLREIEWRRANSII